MWTLYTFSAFLKRSERMLDTWRHVLGSVETHVPGWLVFLDWLIAVLELAKDVPSSIRNGRCGALALLQALAYDALGARHSSR